MIKSDLHLITVGLLLIISLLLYHTINRPAPPNRWGSITGRLNINGVVPMDSTITIYQRRADMPESKFIPFAVNILPEDRVPWTFNHSEYGKNYEIQGVLLKNGKKISMSKPVFVTAPADVILVFDIEGKQAGSADIATMVSIYGYRPPDSQLVLEARVLGDKDFLKVNYDTTADGFIIRSLTSGIIYEIRAILLDSNKTEVGTSNVIQIAAPAPKPREQEILEINSRALPPLESPSKEALSLPISGSILINGAVLPNSTITIFERPVGTKDFQVAVNPTPAINGGSWMWKNAKPGVLHELIAIYKQHQADGSDKEIATSNRLNLIPPAGGVFTINSGYHYAPSNTVTFVCNSTDKKDISSITLTPSIVSEATSYRLQIGTTNGGHEYLDTTYTTYPSQASISIPQANFTIETGKIYYARFAYSLSQQVDTHDEYYSPFGKTTLIRCLN